jgi:3-phosphoshikimate 1-carboxyvinyltransferase
LRQVVEASPRLEGQVQVPGDKSISHRAVILNGIAAGSARLLNFPKSHDCLATINCLQALGVKIAFDRDDGVDITGVGGSGLSEAGDVLDAGNSATCVRLLTGVLAAQPFLSVISGDESLRSRPMRRVVEPLEAMGARIWGREGGTKAPLAIRGGGLRGITYEMPVASAQVKSAILLAGLFAEGRTTVVEGAPTRDHTERLLRAMGGRIEVEGSSVSVEAGGLRSVDVTIPGDISSAAFWMVAAAAHPSARVKLPGVGVNPTRTGILDVLWGMGARLKVDNERTICGELVADIEVESSSLTGTEVSGDMIPRVIDEIPLIALAGAAATGRTVIRDAGELRVKESDRLEATATALSRLGAQVDQLPDGLVIEGGRRLRGGRCSSHGDHRIAMMLGVAGLISGGTTTIDRAEAADVSYSGFWRELRLVAAR